jgi:hypothetical protein
MYAFTIILAGVVRSGPSGKATPFDWWLCVIIALIFWILSKMFSKK